MTATQIIGIEYSHNKNNYGLTATPRYRPLPPPPSELGGEERKRKVESPNRIRTEGGSGCAILSTCTRVSKPCRYTPRGT
ncbi:hypothetical protein TNCV_2961801 [Trichonephila clavipes]|nr:hypothetical protein TNCV_2961801 [Trichonephila clavipes]